MTFKIHFLYLHRFLHGLQLKKDGGNVAINGDWPTAGRPFEFGETSVRNQQHGLLGARVVPSDGHNILVDLVHENLKKMS
jgi:hypothetical protein